jgi:hypothetical protein
VNLINGCQKFLVSGIGNHGGGRRKKPMIIAKKVGGGFLQALRLASSVCFRVMIIYDFLFARSGKKASLDGGEQQKWADAADRIRSHKDFSAVLRDDSLAYFLARATKWAQAVDYLNCM